MGKQWKVAIRITADNELDYESKNTVSEIQQDPPSVDIDGKDSTGTVLLVRKFPFHKSAQRYIFDKILEAATPEAEVYSSLVQPLVHQVCQGQSGTIFFHGSSWASTKRSRGSFKRPLRPELSGLIKRACDELLKHLKNVDANGDGTVHHRIHASVVETFSAKVIDRASPSSSSRKKVFNRDAPLNASFSRLSTHKCAINRTQDILDLLRLVCVSPNGSYRPGTAESSECKQSFSTTRRRSPTPSQLATSLVVTLSIAAHHSPRKDDLRNYVRATAIEDGPTVTLSPTELRFVLLANAEQPKRNKYTTWDGEQHRKVDQSVQRKASKFSFSAHTDAHTYVIDKNIARSLDSLIRCITNNGMGYRDSALTHYLASTFTTHQMCVFAGGVNSSTYDYSKTLATINLAAKVYGASRMQSSCGLTRPLHGENYANTLTNPFVETPDNVLASGAQDEELQSAFQPSEGEDDNLSVNPVVLHRMDSMLESSRKLLQEQLHTSMAHDLGYNSISELEEAHGSTDQSYTDKGLPNEEDHAQTIVLAEMHKRVHTLSSDLANERIAKHKLEQTVQELRDKLWVVEESLKKETATQDAAILDLKRTTDTKISELSFQLESQTNARESVEQQLKLYQSQMDSKYHAAVLAAEEAKQASEELEKENNKLRKQREEAKTLAAQLENRLQNDNKEKIRASKHKKLIERIIQDMRDRSGVVLQRLSPDEPVEEALSTIATSLVDITRSNRALNNDLKLTQGDLQESQQELSNAVKTISVARQAQRTSNENAQMNLKRIESLKQSVEQLEEQISSAGKENQSLYAQLAQTKALLRDSRTESERLRGLWQAAQKRASKSEQQLGEATSAAIRHIHDPDVRSITEENYSKSRNDAPHSQGNFSNKESRPISPFARRVRAEADSSAIHYADITPSFRRRTPSHVQYDEQDSRRRISKGRQRGQSFGSYKSAQSLDPLINSIIDATAARTAETLHWHNTARRVRALPLRRREDYSDRHDTDSY